MGADTTGGFVEQDEEAVGKLERCAVDEDIGRFGLGRWIALDHAGDGDAPTLDQLLHLAAGAETGGGEDLIEAATHRATVEGRAGERKDGLRIERLLLMASIREGNDGGGWQTPACRGGMDRALLATANLRGSPCFPGSQPMNTLRTAPTRRLRFRPASVAGVVVAVCAGLWSGTAVGAVYYWDPNGSAAGEGGAGAWQKEGNDKFFRDANGSYNKWATNSADVAVFGGSGGAVTVHSAGVSANGLEFLANNYSLTGGALTFLGANPYIRIAGGVSTTFSASMAVGASGGSLVLNLEGSGAGTAGTLVFGRSDLFADNVQIDLQGGGVMNLGGYSDTVGSFTLTNGTVQNGTLTAGSYSLRNGTVDAVLAGGSTANLTSSAGAVTLSRANTYGGSTSVTSGSLTLLANYTLPSTTDVTVSGQLVVGAGSLQRVNRVTVVNGELLVGPSGSLAATNGVSLSGSGGQYGRLSGLGAVSSPVTIGSGGIISPAGPGAVGILTTGAQTWGTGGTYEWNIVDASTGAGAGWDLMQLGWNSLTIRENFNLNVIGLGQISGLTAGSTYSWLIASQISDASGLNFGVNILIDGAPMTAGTFSLRTRMDGGLYLDYTTPVPEPRDYAIILGMVTFGLVGYRRWRRVHQVA